MSLYYITGAPGTGKSAIRKELEKLGYEAHDADDPDIGGPYNNDTNEQVSYPENPNEVWFENHSWRLIPQAIEELHNQAKDKTVFLCGTAQNEDDVWHLFDCVLLLDIDEATLQSRITKRTDNAYGKTPHELDLILAKYRASKAKQDRPGVTVIDATLSLEKVVESIINTVSALGKA